MKQYGPVLVLLLTGTIADAQIPVLRGQGGTVTGVLRTVAGMPAANVRVGAMVRPDPPNEPGIASAFVSLALTDEAGRFRLENVPPGQYYIAAGRVDAPTFYPGTLSTAARTVVSVAVGETVSDIEFVVLDPSLSDSARSPFEALQNLNQRFRALQPGLQNGQRGRGGAGLGPATPPIPFPPAGQRRGGGRGPAPAPPPIPVAANAAWWTDASMVARLGLTGEQKMKIETIFDQYRQNLVSTRTTLENEEAALARMLNAEIIEPKMVLPQIDRVSQARGDMEKTYARMTLEMRQILSRPQWMQLQNEVEPDGLNPSKVKRFFGR